MTLKKYFETIISGEKINGSWLIAGLDGEKKLIEILDIAKQLADWNDVFILSDLQKIDEKIKEKFLVYEPARDEAKMGIGIKAARRAIEFLSLSAPSKSGNGAGHRVLIINNAEDLNILAQNTLLKIVEEPPRDAVIFFLSRDEDNLLPTLVSRTKIFRRPLAEGDKYFLDSISDEEKKFFTQSNKDAEFLKKIFLACDEEKIKFVENLAIWGRDSLLKEKNTIWTTAKIKQVLKILSRLKNPAINHKLQLESLLFKIF